MMQEKFQFVANMTHNSFISYTYTLISNFNDFHNQYHAMHDFVVYIENNFDPNVLNWL